MNRCCICERRNGSQGIECAMVGGRRCGVGNRKRGRVEM